MLIDEELLALIRRSAGKDERKRTAYDREREARKKAKALSQKDDTEENLMGRSRIRLDNFHFPAVEYVTWERRKAGLPFDVKEEMAQIEEKLAVKELSKHASVTSELDSYLDTQTFSRKIVNKNWAIRVAKELVGWVNTPRPDGKDPIKITEFFNAKGIYYRDFYRLAKQHEVLQQALDYTLQVLGDIRERNILENKWNTNAGMYMMGRYDNDWRKEQERREAAKLKQAEASGVDVKALFAEYTAPVPQTEEVRVKVESDKSRSTR